MDSKEIARLTAEKFCHGSLVKVSEAWCPPSSSHYYFCRFCLKDVYVRMDGLTRKHRGLTHD